MSLVRVKAPTANRVLNCGRRTYQFDENAIALIREEDSKNLPSTYQIIDKVEVKENIKIEPKEVEPIEVKKVIKKEKDIKKVKQPKKGDIKK